MQKTKRRTGKRHLWNGVIVLFLAAMLSLTAGEAPAATEKLDENEEVQWVMGDLSALKTAAQTYYSDNDNPPLPPLSAVLNYFEPGSLAPNASALYALKADDRGWYVGYQSIGLKSETYRLLQANAEVLGLLGDDLRAPWRYGSRYFWAEALVLSSTGRTNTANTTTVIKGDTGLADVTALVVATAALVSIIADNDNDRYYYYVPGYSWYWNSGLVYRPVYYNRFFRYYCRPLPGPPPRIYPRPYYRWRAPRAGWLDPNWRRSYDYAQRRYPPHYDDRRLDNHYPDRRWRDGRGSVPPAPPGFGRLEPRPPKFRKDPPHMLPPGDRRPDRDPRRRGDERRRSPRPRPDNRSSPEMRRPAQPPRRPGNPPAPDFRRPEQPGRRSEHRDSPGRRRPSPPERRPGNRNAPEMRRPQQPPRAGNDGNRPNIRPPSQQRRPDSGRSPRQENRRPRPPQGRTENVQFRR